MEVEVGGVQKESSPIRHGLSEHFQLIVAGGELGIQAGDLLLDRVHLLDRAGALGLVLLAPDGLRGGVAARLQLVGAPAELAAAAVQLQGLLEERRGRVIKEPLAVDLEDVLRPFTQIFHVEHGAAFFPPQRRGVKIRAQTGSDLWPGPVTLRGKAAAQSRVTGRRPARPTGPRPVDKRRDASQ